MMRDAVRESLGFKKEKSMKSSEETQRQILEPGQECPKVRVTLQIQGFAMACRLAQNLPSDEYLIVQNFIELAKKYATVSHSNELTQYVFEMP